MEICIFSTCPWASWTEICTCPQLMFTCPTFFEKIIRFYSRYKKSLKRFHTRWKRNWLERKHCETLKNRDMYKVHVVSFLSDFKIHLPFGKCYIKIYLPTGRKVQAGPVGHRNSTPLSNDSLHFGKLIDNFSFSIIF